MRRPTRRQRAERHMAALQAFNEHVDQAFDMLDPDRRQYVTRKVETNWMEAAYRAPSARVPAVRHRRKLWAPQ